MRNILLSIALCFVLCNTVVGQEKASDENDKKAATGFKFLQQFEGKWKSSSKPKGEADGVSGTMTAHRLGGQWLVCQHEAMMGSTRFEGLQRVGFDRKTNKFIGSWSDSMSDHVWKYDGTLGVKRLLLNADGPDWTDPSKTQAYRDTYEFKTPDTIETVSQMKNEDGEWKTFMSGTMTRDKSAGETNNKTATITPFLMFEGKAVEAIDYYKTVFPDLQIISMKKYGAGGQGKEGTVELADFSIEGQRVRCIDSPIKHDFEFTPSFSFFVECDSEEQLKQRFDKLSDGGKVMMPLNNYGFSKKFGWASDKFGISWQLNLK